MPLTVQQQKNIYDQARKDLIKLPHLIEREEKNYRSLFMSDDEIRDGYKPGYWKKRGEEILKRIHAAQASYDKNIIPNLKAQLEDAKIKEILFEPLGPLEDVYQPSYLKRYRTRLEKEHKELEEEVMKKQEEYLAKSKKNHRQNK